MNKSQGWIALASLIIGGLIYSISSFAYMHSTFTTRYDLEFLIKKVDNMDDKIDKLLEAK